MKIKKIELYVEMPDGVKDHEILQKILSAIATSRIEIFGFQMIEFNSLAIDIDRQEFDDMKQKIGDIYNKVAL